MDKKSLGYRMGEIFATVLTACASALLIAAVIKIIIWLLF